MPAINVRNPRPMSNNAMIVNNPPRRKALCGLIPGRQLHQEIGPPAGGSYAWDSCALLSGTRCSLYMPVVLLEHSRKWIYLQVVFLCSCAILKRSSHLFLLETVYE